MKLPLRPHIARMKGYQPGEQPADRTLVKLNTNENPYPPSPWVQAAVERAAADELNRYPAPMSDRVRELAADRYRVSPEQVSSDTPISAKSSASLSSSAMYLLQIGQCRPR